MKLWYCYSLCRKNPIKKVQFEFSVNLTCEIKFANLRVSKRLASRWVLTYFFFHFAYAFLTPQLSENTKIQRLTILIRLHCRSEKLCNYVMKYSITASHSRK